MFIYLFFEARSHVACAGLELLTPTVYLSRITGTPLHLYPLSPPRLLLRSLGNLKLQCELHYIYEGKDRLRRRQPARTSLQQPRGTAVKYVPRSWAKRWCHSWVSGDHHLQNYRAQEVGTKSAPSLPDSSPLRAEMHSYLEASVFIATSLEDRCCLRFDLP